MICGINTTSDISKLSQISYNNFEKSLVVFMPNITTNHAITYTNVNLGIFTIFVKRHELLGHVVLYKYSVIIIIIIIIIIVTLYSPLFLAKPSYSDFPTFLKNVLNKFALK